MISHVQDCDSIVLVKHDMPPNQKNKYIPHLNPKLITWFIKAAIWTQRITWNRIICELYR